MVVMMKGKKVFPAGVTLALVLLASCATESPVRTLENGKLRLCPKSPNCVSSESDIEMTAIAPVTYHGDSQKAFEQIKAVLLTMGGNVRSEESGYLWVTFRSRLLRYVDDVEVRRVPGENVLHIRSGSREGYSDMGVNRKRVEHIRRHFNEVQGSSKNR